jgi:hypothetical protein
LIVGGGAADVLRRVGDRPVGRDVHQANWTAGTRTGDGAQGADRGGMVTGGDLKDADRRGLGKARSQWLLILELEADLHLDLEVCNFVALHVPSDIAHLHPVDLTQISGGAFDAGSHRLGDAVRGGSGDLDDFVGVGFGQLCSFCVNHTAVDV